MGEKDKNLLVYGFEKWKAANEQQESQFKDRTESDLDLLGGWVNLTLKDVTEMDSGIYRCQGYNENGSWTQNIRLYIEGKTLEVKGAPHETIVLPCKCNIKSGTEDSWHLSWVKMEEKAENNLLVHRFEKGKPANEDPVIPFQNRTEMVFDWSGGSVNLSLKDVTEMDSGLYRCQGYNASYAWTQNITLLIEDRTPSESRSRIGRYALVVWISILVTAFLCHVMRNNNAARPQANGPLEVIL
ncbi:uncharacterized protein LOC134601743 [Pelobates fuscus]|uniref:uncharacterized protein LOC134601743 n=1 Tax=Pelobates fuscus TaxID=191477 RepID=UPI002FE46D2C